MFTSISPPFEASSAFLLVASRTFCILMLQPELGVFTATVKRRSQFQSVDQVEVFALRFLLCFVFSLESVFLVDLLKKTDLGLDYKMMLQDK